MEADCQEQHHCIRSRELGSLTMEKRGNKSSQHLLNIANDQGVHVQGCMYGTSVR
jgi:hypothetical protein